MALSKPTMSEEERRVELSEMFDFLDKEKAGKLYIAEVVEFLRSKGVALSHAEVGEMLGGMAEFREKRENSDGSGDACDDGAITRDQFVNFMAKVVPGMEEADGMLEDLFKSFTVGGNGNSISMPQLREILRMMSIANGTRRVTSEEMYAALREAEVDTKKGTMDLEGFKNVIAYVSQVIADNPQMTESEARRRQKDAEDPLACLRMPRHY